MGGDAQGDTLVGIEIVIGSAFGRPPLWQRRRQCADRWRRRRPAPRQGGAPMCSTAADGLDFANYQGSAAAVSVNLLTGAHLRQRRPGRQLPGIENVYGSKQNDQHHRRRNARSIIGGGELGNDTLIGSGGDDTLSGGDRRRQPCRRRRRQRLRLVRTGRHRRHRRRRRHRHGVDNDEATRSSASAGHDTILAAPGTASGGTAATAATR